MKALPDGNAPFAAFRRRREGSPGRLANSMVGIWSVSAHQWTSELEAAGKPGLRGFPENQPNVEDAIQRAVDAPENDQTGGCLKACRRKRLHVALRRSGTAASSVMSIGNAANQRASARWRTAEPANIGLKARLEGNTESKAFRRGRQRGPRRSLPPVKLRSDASVASRTTADPTVVGGPHERVNPIQGASARRRPTLTAPPSGDSRTSELRQRGEPDTGRWTVQEPSSKRSPDPKCLGTDEKATSKSCSVGDS